MTLRATNRDFCTSRGRASGDAGISAGSYQRELGVGIVKVILRKIQVIHGFKSLVKESEPAQRLIQGALPS